MKKMLAVIKNEKGEILPVGDIETFTVSVYEIPQVGDYFFLDETDDIEEGDQTSYMNIFCLLEWPQRAATGFRFKVVGRTVCRANHESWVYVELQYEPDAQFVNP
jgi:hypothetical protein